MAKILIRKQNGINTIKIFLDLDEILANGKYKTEDSLGWPVTAELIE